MRSNGHLRRFARERMRGNFDVLFGIIMLIGVMEFGVSFLSGYIPFLWLANFLILTPAFALSQSYVFLRLVRGYRPAGKDAFYGFKDFWAAFKTTFLVGLYTFLWSLLLIVPGIIKAISYSQALYIVAENPGIGANEAIARSEDLMQGKKGQYFFLGFSFIGWILLGILTFGLLYIWLIPYMYTTQAVFYCELIVDEEARAASQVQSWGNGYFSYMYNGGTPNGTPTNGASTIGTPPQAGTNQPGFPPPDSPVQGGTPQTPFPPQGGTNPFAPPVNPYGNPYSNTVQGGNPFAPPPFPGNETAPTASTKTEGTPADSAESGAFANGAEGTNGSKSLESAPAEPVEFVPEMPAEEPSGSDEE